MNDQVFKKLPGVVALTRGLVIGDATMFSELSDGSLKPLPVVRHGIRGTQNVDREGKEGTSGTVKRRQVSNIQTTDSAKSDPDAVALIVRFGLRFAEVGSLPVVVAGGEKDNPQDIAALRESIYRFIERAKQSNCLQEIALRYARNIANGRWLWRNRMVASSVRVQVRSNDRTLSFDALSIPLNAFSDFSDDERLLAASIEDGLAGRSAVGIEVEARLEMGFVGSFEVYPSQNYLENKPTGFARSLYCLGMPERKIESGMQIMGQAAIRDQKVANALRTFDTWYPDFSNVGRPIAVEPNGANLEAQNFYRDIASPASAFKMMGRLNQIDPASDDGLFMLACILRGGVYSGGKSA